MNSQEKHELPPSVLKNDRCIVKNASASFLLLCILSLAFCNCRSTDSLTQTASGIFVVWAHSDIHSRDQRDMNNYAKAVEDVRAKIPRVDMAIVAGDIVHRKGSQREFEWFLKEREKAGIPRWYEIAGNHDLKDLENYVKYVGKPSHYSVTAGNILFLFMSSEDRYDKPPTVISDETFEWWRDMVERNQDRIIITVTHGALTQSRLTGTFYQKVVIRYSERFVDVLKKFKVDLWISGHSHLPEYFTKHRVDDNLNGTLFLDVSSIKKEFLGGLISRFLFFKTNSDRLLIRLRKHEGGRFDSRYEIDHGLSRPFQWDGSPPRFSLPPPGNAMKKDIPHW